MEVDDDDLLQERYHQMGNMIYVTVQPRNMGIGLLLMVLSHVWYIYEG